MNRRPVRVDPQILGHAREMRRKPATSEQKLWYRLRDRRLNGYKFRRQFAIGRYIADFYCATCRLIIELDGDSHATRQDYDCRRSEYLETDGYSFIRFTNTDLQKHFDAVLLAILKECETRSQIEA